MKKILIVCILFFSQTVNAQKNQVTNSSNSQASMSAAVCSPSTASSELNISNVRTTVLAGGDMWTDLSNSRYEIPIGSGKHSMYVGALWMAGIDAGGQLKVAAQTYRQNGNDFWPGTLDTTTNSINSARCQYYNKHWKITRSDVVDFVTTGTTTNQNIIQWPGNGNPLYNESVSLAPFFDMNGDGIYNHIDGDYPGYNLHPANVFPYVPGSTAPICNDYLMGYQTIWWVINDVGNIHSNTSSQPMGIEIRCQAFAIPSTSPAINNSTFYKYQVINRSSSTYSDSYFAQWADPDIGNYFDDYVGCDVIRGLGYCYNGDWDDEGSSGYGMNPPAIGIDLLHGPKADIGDAVDNDFDGCIDCTYLDSMGFTIVLPDFEYQEPISISKFIYYDNNSNPATGNPSTFSHYYQYLKGFWLDGQQITYGANGRNPANPPCNFVYPETTDPSFLTNWTELSSGNPPDDKRFLMSAGPYTMEPGEVNYISTAVVWARATSGGPWASVALLKQHDSQIQDYFNNCFRVLGTGIDEVDESAGITVFPNPSSDMVKFNLQKLNQDCELNIFSSRGEKVFSTKVKAGEIFEWSTEIFAKGIYFYELKNEDKNIKSGKIVLH